MMRALLATAAAAFTIAPTPAEACSISMSPGATFYGSTAGEPGRRPWIALWNVGGKDPIAINVVTLDPVATTPSGDRCEPGAICKGKPIAFEREGKYLRPTADLPAGARVQVLFGKRLLAETVVSKASPTALPVWAGVDLVQVSATSKSMCSTGGPEVALKVKPTKAKLDNTVALFYLTRPDAKAPHKNLVKVYPLGYGPDLTLSNDFDFTFMKGAGPTELWMLLADDHGNVGAPIKLI